MNLNALDRLVNALIYEGYLLYPYRPAMKNNVRWTFGGLFPRPWSEAEPDRDHWHTRADVLLEADPSATIDVQLRFLHVVDRQVFARVKDHCEPVDCLVVDDLEYRSWQECVERRVDVTFSLRDLLAQPADRRFSFADKPRHEHVTARDGDSKGVLVRRQACVRGILHVTAMPAGDDAAMIAVSIANDSRMSDVFASPVRRTGLSDAGRDREAASLYAMAALHVIVQCDRGQFVSAIDPPTERRQMVEQARSDGLWPVLVGTPGERDTMLCSPIILYDYPQIAEQSPGDYFDGTEIDEMLALRVLTLSDDEKRQVAGFDQRGQALLMRTRDLANRQLADLHGVTRRVESCKEARHGG